MTATLSVTVWQWTILRINVDVKEHPAAPGEVGHNGAHPSLSDRIVRHVALKHVLHTT